MKLAPKPDMVPLDDLDPGVLVYLLLEEDRVPALLAVAEPDGVEGFVTLHPHPRHPVPHWVHSDEFEVDELLVYPEGCFELGTTKPMSLSPDTNPLPGHVIVKEDELYLCFASESGEGPQGFLNLATGEATAELEYPLAIFASWRVRAYEGGPTVVAHGVEA